MSYSAFKSLKITSLITDPVPPANSSYTASIIGAVNSLFAAGAGFGAIAQGWTADWLGRPKAFAAATVISLVGGALTAGSVNIPMLIVFRFVQGFGLGQVLALVPLYISETAPAHRRGALTSFTAGGFAVGYFRYGYFPRFLPRILLIFVSAAWVGYGAYFAKSLTVQWRMPLALTCLSPIIILIGVWWLPESPRYLSWVNRSDEALEVLRKIHHDPDDPLDTAAKAEHVQITKQVEFDKEIKAGYIQMFTKPSWRKRSLLAFFLIFAMQSAGILGITNYIILISGDLGLTGSMPLLMYGIYIVVAGGANLLNSLAEDRLGRRTMFCELSLFHGASRGLT